MLKRLFPFCLAASVFLFALAPFVIARAPYEATMGLVQKIFYVHVPAAVMFLLSTFVCGIASLIFLFGKRPRADRFAVSAAELAAVFGVIMLVTGPLWGRKSWGVWWQWDPRLTSTFVLFMIVLAYLLLRTYGGVGSERLAAGLALFGMANVPFVYWSVNVWRTIHPRTTVVPTLGPGMFGAFWWCMGAFAVLYLALLGARVHLEDQRAQIERLYRELEE